MTAPAPLADQTALARTGAAVRARLADDPSVYRVPTDLAEIFAVGGFLSADECAALMERIDHVARPSTVFDVEGEQDHAMADYRTSYSGDIDRGDTMVRAIERRICDLLGLDERWGESVQGQRYAPGQHYRAHHDWFDTTARYWAGEKARGGQRSWTTMAYLNAVEEGGATEFPRLGISIAPQPGALMVWNNARPDGSPNPDTIHAAMPVVRGVKYVATKWFRTRPWG